MRKWNRIITEVVGWCFLIMAFLYSWEMLSAIAGEQTAMVVTAWAAAGVLFAVFGFGFIFLNRIEEIKYNSRTPESDEYAEQLVRQEEQKKQRNWIIIGIAIGFVLILLALLPVFVR